MNGSTPLSTNSPLTTAQLIQLISQLVNQQGGTTNFPQNQAAQFQSLSSIPGSNPNLTPRQQQYFGNTPSNQLLEQFANLPPDQQKALGGQSMADRASWALQQSGHPNPTPSESYQSEPGIPTEVSAAVGNITAAGQGQQMGGLNQLAGLFNKFLQNQSQQKPPTPPPTMTPTATSLPAGFTGTPSAPSAPSSTQVSTQPPSALAPLNLASLASATGSGTTNPMMGIPAMRSYVNPQILQSYGGSPANFGSNISQGIEGTSAGATMANPANFGSNITQGVGGTPLQGGGLTPNQMNAIGSGIGGLASSIGKMFQPGQLQIPTFGPLPQPTPMSFPQMV